MIVDRIWRFFCSVKAAVGEIVVLALLVLLGTLRGSSVPAWIADYVPVLQPVVDRWYAWDVFHSLPFMGILAILCVAITVCTINRVPGIWKTISDPTIRTSRGFLDSTLLSAKVDSPATPDETLEMIGASLKSKRYRVQTEVVGSDTHLYADKNRYAKLGTFPFHLALILLLVGGIVGARYGFKDNAFIIPEGSTRAVGHGTGLTVTLEQFNDSWREEGTPAEYRSDLLLMKNGEEVGRKSITVNDPMVHGTVTFYQASFGQAVSMRVTDDQGMVLFDDSIPLGQYTSSTNPDAPAGVQVLPQAGLQLNVIAPDENRANAPMLDNLNLASGQMFVQVRNLNAGNAASEAAVESAVLTQGEVTKVGNVNVEFIRERRYTMLQVASNPGMPIFWTAAFLLVAGLAITFYLPQRRIRGIVSPNATGEGSTVMIAPMARWDWSAQRDFKRSMELLESESGLKPVITEKEQSRSLNEPAAAG